MKSIVTRGKSPSIVLPEGMTYDQALQHIITQKEQETYGEREVRVEEVIRRYPYEAALALAKAIMLMYEGMHQFDRPVPGGVIEAKMVSIPISATEYVNVPWGPFTVPGIEGYLETQHYREGNAIYMLLTAKVKRKYEPAVKALADLARKLVIADSLYQGQAIEVTFEPDQETGKIPPPKFMRLSSSLDPIFSNHVQEEIDRSVIIPITQPERTREAGMSPKRSILLHGEYGTGKSLTANYIARACIAQGRTFIYVPRPKEYADALRLAVEYSPAAIFVDDIDRVTEGMRTEEMDELLIRIDGVDTKDSDIFQVTTTNNIDIMHPAFLRPGRSDVIIKVDDVDEDTARRLLRRFSEPIFDENKSLDPLAEKLAGKTAAFIREIVDRAKLDTIRDTLPSAKLTMKVAAIERMLAVVSKEREGIDASSTERQLARKANSLNGKGQYA